MYLYNSPEYCETNFAAMKIRGTPINVNYRYLDNELPTCSTTPTSRRSCSTPRWATASPGCATGWPGQVLVEVDDGPAADGSSHVDGAVGYEEIQATLRRRRASPRRATRPTCSTPAARRGCRRA